MPCRYLADNQLACLVVIIITASLKIIYHALQEYCRATGAAFHNCAATLPNLDTSTTSSAGATGAACSTNPKLKALL